MVVGFAYLMYLRAADSTRIGLLSQVFGDLSDETA